MLTAARLREILDYCPTSGVFRWRQPLNMRLRRGSIAGADTKFGYRAVQIYGKKRYLHRLAWLYVYGNWPSGQVDHIDRNRKNNAVANLREASSSQNRVNAAARRDSTLGVRGVGRSASGKFTVVLCKGRRKYFGSYDTLDEAIVVRDHEAVRMHGKFYHRPPVRKPDSNCATHVEN